ncbi:MAG: hypothetical protein M0R03_07290, partial [Novosphingobium sp.]|nr:hypothetical protein [Novosphingobium sp.]
DSATLAAMTEFKVEVHDDRYEVEPILRGGGFLYDPQVVWDWCADGSRSPWAGPEGSILISDIGGQRVPELDWNLGHGGLFRLHADNTWETLVPHGSGMQAGFFRPTIAPEGWGDFGGHMFLCSQIVPHRRGAVFDHMVYRLAPGDDKPTAFAIPPRSGKTDGGISGALVPGAFGRKGTPEEGLFLFFSMHNMTIYAARPDGSVEPYILMDGEDGRPGPCMPYRVYYADPRLVGEENMLVVEGKWNSHFGGESGHVFRVASYRIAGRTVDPAPIEALGGGPGFRAPAAFGPLAGDSFRPENNGFMSSINWTEGDAQVLPYTTEIIRRDSDGNEHVFASNIQAGQNLIGFAGGRLIVTNMGHSYSSGNFKHPDGSVFAIRPRR